ncbi:G/T mismatches repair enzyme [uncultured archaeon]|nr:G/T mismatches repair enzyme [uncultured archaeon]
MLVAMLSLQSGSRTIPRETVQRFQKKVFSFYQQNKRELPWRNTTDPYKILVSELMLQQTQVSRVISYYERWIARWPTISDLASASRAEVLKAWMGLGYNTRAVYLHKAAQKIVAEYDGDVLTAMKQYQEIPGVGRYTAQAVQIFSRNTDLVTVDTNIRRIFIAEFHLSEELSMRELWGYAEQCLPLGRSREWHNALMDYGALHQTAKKTGIRSVSQQSEFEGSDRQRRAAVLRLLLSGPASFDTIHRALGGERMKIRKILGKMVDEDLLVLQNKRYQVKE